MWELTSTGLKDPFDIATANQASGRTSCGEGAEKGKNMKGRGKIEVEGLSSTAEPHGHISVVVMNAR